MQIKSGPFFLDIDESKVTIGGPNVTKPNWYYHSFASIAAACQRLIEAEDKYITQLLSGDCPDEFSRRIRDHIKTKGLSKSEAVKYAYKEFGIVSLYDAEDWVETFWVEPKRFLGTLNYLPTTSGPVINTTHFGEDLSVVETEKGFYCVVLK